MKATPRCWQIGRKVSAARAMAAVGLGIERRFLLSLVKARGANPLIDETPRAQTRPYADPLAEEMAVHMIRNMKDFSLPLFDMSTGKQGIVHVIGPELGLTQPGMTIACGDSHTSTHGAVGAVARSK